VGPRKVPGPPGRRVDMRLTTSPSEIIYVKKPNDRWRVNTEDVLLSSRNPRFTKDRTAKGNFAFLTEWKQLFLQ
jgi:hypothetical protein